MASYNRVILLGNMTRDVELRYTQGGTAVTDISMAVNDRRKSQTGEWVEETTYVDVTLWGRTAEVAGEYLGKGSPILVEGRLKLDTWETEGQKRSKLRVVCDRMQMLGSGSPPSNSNFPRDQHNDEPGGFGEPAHHGSPGDSPGPQHNSRGGDSEFYDSNIPF